MLKKDSKIILKQKLQNYTPPKKKQQQQQQNIDCNVK